MDFVEILGSEQLVHFTIDAVRVRDEAELRDRTETDAGTRTEQGEIVAASVAEGVARIDPRSQIRARDRAIFSVDVQQLHFFDPDSGDAIASAPAPAY